MHRSDCRRRADDLEAKRRATPLLILDGCATGPLGPSDDADIRYGGIAGIRVMTRHNSKERPNIDGVLSSD